MVREYELGLVISPNLSDEQTEALIVRIGQLIESHGGEIAPLLRWGRRRLAYPIQRHREGYYTFMTFMLESEAVREIERFLLVQEDIMRHLIVFLDPRTKAERQRRLDVAAAAAATAANAASAAAREPAPLPVPESVPEPEPTTESVPALAAATEQELVAALEPAQPDDGAPEEASLTVAQATSAAESAPTTVE